MSEGAIKRPAKAEAASSEVSRVELGNGVVIALSGLLISFAAYEADLWSGEESLNFSRANILYTQAARTWGRANALQAVEVQLFSEWLNATLHKDTALSVFYANHLPADAQPAFRAWLALDPRKPGSPPSPMVMPQYAPAGPTKAAALERQGDQAFADGQRAKRIGDSYSQAGAILSTSLFFAGISQIFSMRGIRYVLLALGAFACGLGIWRLFTLPLLSLMSSAA
ncbi:MAG TPA: hypothetical protein VK801_17245 [Caulobacteraceae bacterium]|nr:hypothetical protein [Caulobacteraceae bacterium]